MEESILISIKKLLGITSDYTHFDQDIIMHINSVFMILTQLGVGPAEGFAIEDDSATWDEFLTDVTKYAAVKSYMHHKVRLLFDPPTSSAVMDALNKVIDECEWRLNIVAETSGSDE